MADKVPSLCIFANFRIDNEERYNRLKCSFESFKGISAKKWVVNVRGSYALKVLLFLNENLGERLHPFLLESKSGWFCDSRQMLKHIDTDFVFFWIEDHLNMVDVDIYDQMLVDMKNTNSDLLIYSFLNEAYLSRYRGVQPARETENLKVYNLDRKTIRYIENENGEQGYLTTAVSFLDARFFRKVINSNHPWLKRYPRDTPFDFEKKFTDLEFAPVMYAVPKYELFASIDDDFGVEGYSLISRGFLGWMHREQIIQMEYGEKKISRNKIVQFVKSCSCIFGGRFALRTLRGFFNLLRRIKYTLL